MFDIFTPAHHRVRVANVDGERELFTPVVFETERDGETVRVTADELVAQSTAAAAQYEAETAALQQRRRAATRDAIDRAEAAADADALVDAGDWIGFTRARALGWSWALGQYEPYGFTHPGSELRARRERLLRDGGLPDSRIYVTRARELEANRVTPREHVTMMEALGRRAAF